MLGGIPQTEDVLELLNLVSECPLLLLSVAVCHI